MALTVRSKARKPAGLTVAKATVDAGRITRQIMPGVMVTVQSKLSHDLATDTPTVVTTITFPENAYRANDLALALRDRLNAMIEHDSARIVLTRTR